MGDVAATGRITRSSCKAMAASTVLANAVAQTGEQCDVVDAVENDDRGEVFATVDEGSTNAYRKTKLKEVSIMLTRFAKEQQIMVNANLVSPEKHPPDSAMKVVTPEKSVVSTKFERATRSLKRKRAVSTVVTPEKSVVSTKPKRAMRSSKRKRAVSTVVTPEKSVVSTKPERETHSSERKCAVKVVIPKKRSVSNVVIPEKHVRHASIPRTVKVKRDVSAGGSVAKAAASVHAKYKTLRQKKGASASAQDVFAAEDDIPLSQLLGTKAKRSERDVSSTGTKHVTHHRECSEHDVSSTGTKRVMCPRKAKQVCKRIAAKFRTVVKEVEQQEGQTTVQYGRPEKYRKCQHSYTCCVCEEKFTTLTMYNKHAPSHGYHPCGLPYCNQWFRVLSALEMHRSLHRAGGKLTFPCSTCGEKFSHPSVCNKHAACHGMKLVKCYDPQCTKTFRRKGDMKGHMKCHDPGQHVCDICGKQFHAQSNLKKHRHNHFAPSIKCKQCTAKFHQYQQLKRHVAKVHAQ